jgi:hypothetical protein
MLLFVNDSLHLFGAEWHSAYTDTALIDTQLTQDKLEVTINWAAKVIEAPGWLVVSCGQWVNPESHSSHWGMILSSKLSWRASITAGPPPKGINLINIFPSRKYAIYVGGSWRGKPLLLYSMVICYSKLTYTHMGRGGGTTHHPVAFYLRIWLIDVLEGTLLQYLFIY